MPDPLLTSAHDILRRAHEDTRAVIEGLPADALNWRPAGDDTNSIAVLANHSLTSTRWWLTLAVGQPLPQRDRDAEFRAQAPDAPALLAFTDGMFADCLALLDPTCAVDWSAFRQATPSSTPYAAWCLLHALEHLREHVGQMSLTRQLALARNQ